MPEMMVDDAKASITIAVLAAIRILGRNSLWFRHHDESAATVPLEGRRTTIGYS
jgi:hypothetical protein